MITERVAHFVSEISSADIPQEAFEYARKGITDFIGVALAGSKQDAGNIIADCVKEMGGTASAGTEYEYGPGPVAAIDSGFKAKLSASMQTTGLVPSLCIASYVNRRR